jgi:hypothetical protein
MEKTKPKNYFNEEKVKEWIFEYQRTAIKEKNSEGKEVVIWKDKNLENKITLEIEKIVKAIIQVYRYYIFEPYDDCLQHGLMNCYTNYIKYTPEKGTVFNFFSIISKRSLLNYTSRRQKHRNHSDIADQMDLYSKEIPDLDFFLDEMKTNLIEIINKNYLGKQREKFIKITIILHDYMYKTKKFISKTDFYSWCRSYGLRGIDIREFIKEMKEHGTELFGEHY